MIANILTNDKPSCTRLEKLGVRLILAFSAGICFMLTFFVPLEWLTVFKCPFLALTGLPCPFCGFTRSLWAISAGDWLYATANCPLAWLLYAAILMVLIWSVGSLLTGAKMTAPSGLRPLFQRPNLVTGIAITLTLLNWLYRLSFGLT